MDPLQPSNPFLQPYMWPVLILAPLLLFLVYYLPAPAAKRKKILTWLWRLALLVLVIGVVRSYIRSGPPGSPQRAASNFLAATERRDCATAWSHMNKVLLEPQNLLCAATAANPFLRYRSSPAELLRMEGESAVVGVQVGIDEGFLIPGFFPTRTRYEDRELTLVQESSEWKIVYSPNIRR